MLSETLTVLASSGAGALAAAMATDAWQGARAGAVRLFRRRGDDGQAALEGQLDRQAALVQEADDADEARQLVQGQWQLEFAQLLREHPEAAAELNSLVEGIRSELPEPQQNWVQNITARDHATAYGVQGGNVNHYHQAPRPTPGAAEEDPR
ncbi:hypothetical protein [Streptomyces sp. NBC_01506]|uniref:hypothetical protein n=1 Tax=Streptomyces sp. NBC_01506 TaxID=2903887 RepID=UPI00386641E7